MPGIFHLVEDVAESTGVRMPTLMSMARNLQENGMLPKAVGRAIPQAEPEHIVSVFLAAMIEPLHRQTAQEVLAYKSLKLRSSDNEFSTETSSLGDILTDYASLLLANELDEEMREMRQIVAATRLRIYTNWRAAELVSPSLVIDGERQAAEVEVFTLPGREWNWQGQLARIAEIELRSISLLGLKKGRDYGFSGSE